MDNLHGAPATIGDPNDGIRLMQAYLSNDSKATPIVPSNKRFAENTVPAGDPAAGNPMLYRVSKGPEGTSGHLHRLQRQQAVTPTIPLSRDGLCCFAIVGPENVTQGIGWVLGAFFWDRRVMGSYCLVGPVDYRHSRPIFPFMFGYTTR